MEEYYYVYFNCDGTFLASDHGLRKFADLEDAKAFIKKNLEIGHALKNFRIIKGRDLIVNYTEVRRMEIVIEGDD